MIEIGCFLCGLAVVEAVHHTIAKRANKKYESTWQLFTKGGWR